MNVRLKGLPTGDWRDLDEQELAGLFKMIEHSSSEAKPKPVQKKNKSRNRKRQHSSHVET
jgi:23S rRNA pseudouridine2604 synthase